jgi:hypothetical protein
MTTEKFIIKAKIIHGSDFDYSKVIYKHSREKINLVCNKCDFNYLLHLIIIHQLSPSVLIVKR